MSYSRLAIFSLLFIFLSQLLVSAIFSTPETILNSELSLSRKIVCSEESSTHTMLHCPASSVITSIDFVSYGSKVKGKCGSYTHVNAGCNSAYSISLLQSSCLGKSSCKVLNKKVDANLRYSCNSVSKALTIQATCSILSSSSDHSLAADDKQNHRNEMQRINSNYPKQNHIERAPALLAFNNDIDLGSLSLADNEIGFEMKSTNTTGSFWVVSTAGDFNGDGFDDIVIGVSKASPYGRSEAGITYVVFGHATTTSTSIMDLDLDDSAFTSSGKGFRIFGASAGDLSGTSVSRAWFNYNNGYRCDNIIIGAKGCSYVIAGRYSSFKDIDLAVLDINADSSLGFKIISSSSSNDFGLIVSPAGDVNQDGLEDIIIGAPSDDYSGRPFAGSNYVIYGIYPKYNYYTNVYDAYFSLSLDFYNRDKFVSFKGSLSHERIGYSNTGADFNGDGSADIIIGSYLNDVVYVTLGRNARDFTDLQASYLWARRGYGFKIYGATGEGLGWSVSGAGDINGDGYDDIIIGAPFASPDPTQPNTGIIYIVFGHINTNPVEDLDLTSSTFTSSGKGFKILGSVPNFDELATGLGTSVSKTGDVNGDGFDDITIVDQNAVSTYVVFGHRFNFNDINLSDDNFFSSGKGFKIIGGNGYQRDLSSGISGGDFNGDGIADILIGQLDQGFVIFGEKNDNPHPRVFSTRDPTSDPTVNPTVEPTTPTTSPTINPTTFKPTFSPSVKSSLKPTIKSSFNPTKSPSNKPSYKPTVVPSAKPTLFPSMPTNNPTLVPSTLIPTDNPTVVPSTSMPTDNPTVAPLMPTIKPIKPTVVPSMPINNPTLAPM